MHPIETSRPQRRPQASSWARRLSSSRCAWSPKKSPVTFPRSVRAPGVIPAGPRASRTRAGASAGEWPSASLDK
jgi:hypothetical protein